MLWLRRRTDRSVRLGRPESQDAALLGPRGWDRLQSLEISGCQRNWLAAAQNCFDNIGSQKCQRENPGYFAIVNSGTASDLGCGFREAGGKPLDPDMGLRNCINQNRVDKCCPRLHSTEHELCFDASASQGKCYFMRVMLVGVTRAIELDPESGGKVLPINCQRQLSGLEGYASNQIPNDCFFSDT